MLDTNRLNPPHSFFASPATIARPIAPAGSGMFVSADDFDPTGILAGCDPCASSYWWMPELHAAAPAECAVATVLDPSERRHATRRASAPPQAAA